MVHRLVSAATVAVLAVFAPAVLAPAVAEADSSWQVRSIDWRRDHDRDRDRRPDLERRQDHDRRGRHFIVPRTYFVPAYVTPAPTWVPGYWIWRWVPQAQTAYVYVPGYYDQYGSWVSSRYEPRSTESGFYQQVWVEGYWQ